MTCLFSHLFFLSLAAGLWAQAAPPSVPPDAVVATVNGRKFTAAELDKVLSGAPPQIQQNFATNRREFLQQYALVLRLNEMAAKVGLDKKSPYKEQLEWVRAQVLMQAQITEHSNQINVLPEDQAQFYEKNRERYRRAKVKVIYIPYSLTPPPQTDPKAKKVLTDAEAKAKAESLLQQIRAGADFVKLVKQHSEDAASAAKDGDFGAIHGSDKIPQEIKTAIFALKAGEVSEPIRQPNGYYLFRVEETGAQPYEEVKDTINREVKQARFQEWFESVRRSIEVKYENEAYFSPAPAN